MLYESIALPLSYVGWGRLSIAIGLRRERGAAMDADRLRGDHDHYFGYATGR